MLKVKYSLLTSQPQRPKFGLMANKKINKKPIHSVC